MVCWKMLERRRNKFILLCIVLVACLLVYLTTWGSPVTRHPQFFKDDPFEFLPALHREVEGYVRGDIGHRNFDKISLKREYNMDIDGKDVLVFLHIQKTGGTSFGRHLVNNIDLKAPCKCTKRRKRCECLNSRQHIWLFSRYSTGWLCGLHADWTELKNCVSDALDKREKEHRKRRYLYLTILRDPLWRYLSEWKHVQRGSTWMAAQLKCDGRFATLEEVPFCWSGADWSGVTLNEFVQCKHNLANNRQVRMLANLSKVDCYNITSMSEEARDHYMLESAKENLRELAFFGLLEYQTETQYLFEKTFNLTFIEDFVQYNVTHASKASINEQQRKKVIEINSLDVALYQYAKDLFFQRFNKLREIDQDGQGNIKLLHSKSVMNPRIKLHQNESRHHRKHKKHSKKKSPDDDE